MYAFPDLWISWTRMNDLHIVHNWDQIIICLIDKVSFWMFKLETMWPFTHRSKIASPKCRFKLVLILCAFLRLFHRRRPTFSWNWTKFDQIEVVDFNLGIFQSQLSNYALKVKFVSIPLAAPKPSTTYTRTHTPPFTCLHVLGHNFVNKKVSTDQDEMWWRGVGAVYLSIKKARRKDVIQLQSVQVKLEEHKPRVSSSHSLLSSNDACHRKVSRKMSW